MQAVFLEDTGASRFGPLTLLRPEFDLRCGMLTLLEKLERRRPDWRVALLPRPELTELVSEAHPGREVETLDDAPTLVLYGRVIVDDAFLAAVEGVDGEAILTSGGEVIGAVVRNGAAERLRASDAAARGVGSLDIGTSVEVAARTVRYPWDLVAATGRELEEDAAIAVKSWSADVELHRCVRLENDGRIAVGEGCDIGPSVVLDAREGPVVIGRDVCVMPNAVLVGPVFVGDGSVVRAGATVHGGTSIGPVCKVGGEIAASVLQSHANKQHGGFLGHSFVGSWVNLGAATNTSDLKNNYGVVRVEMDGEEIDTGLLSVGACIGDHSKTAIGTRLTTGTVMGVFCSVVADGFAPRSIPSFSWVTPDGLVRYDAVKAIDTARTVMERRGESLTPALERRITDLHGAGV